MTMYAVGLYIYICRHTVRKLISADGVEHLQYITVQTHCFELISDSKFELARLSLQFGSLLSLLKQNWNSSRPSLNLDCSWEEAERNE